MVVNKEIKNLNQKYKSVKNNSLNKKINNSSINKKIKIIIVI